AELQQILEARLAELTQVMRQSESVTRRVVSAELEIARHRGTAQQLDSETASLQAEVDAALAYTAQVRDRHTVLTAERARHRAEIERLEAEVGSADAELAAGRAQVDALEAQANALRSENASLKTKLKTLEQNVARMRHLKEELMSSISGMTQEMSGLAGGDD
ncbi:MAG: hypothetical protein GXP62_13940, partial [Oligoflexia bacterium]|nr:hypothetical protein [Oligoflexia bacterium]